MIDDRHVGYFAAEVTIDEVFGVRSTLCGARDRTGAFRRRTVDVGRPAQQRVSSARQAGGGDRGRSLMVRESGKCPRSASLLLGQQRQQGNDNDDGVRSRRHWIEASDVLCHHFTI